MSSQDELKKGKSRGKPKANPFKKIVWQGFINCRLSDEQKEDFEAWWEAGIPDLSGKWLGLVKDGYKTTLSWDIPKNTYTATITDNDAQSELAGWALSAFGDSPEKAIAVLLYKHNVVLVDGWVVGEQQQAKYG